MTEVNDHHSSASAEFGNDEFDIDDDDDEAHTSAITSALFQGWVRAAYGGEVRKMFSASWEPGIANERAKTALLRLIARLPDADEYRINKQIVQTKREASAIIRG
ncbi:MAG: hypothetical protein EOP83_32580 [Verrucomicrobiaceae bacterium]|nr:MAG: hypothetical protein EOP83_32580 [Verrucomicrobiaceae bacterium]